MEQTPVPSLRSRLDVHHRKQLELKLEYQPSEVDAQTRYGVEMYAFLPVSLNVDAETYPRNDFYADLHNYVRFKTPVLELGEVLEGEGSPLPKLEAWLRTGLMEEGEVVYQAKMLACVFRGGLRRFAQGVESWCLRLAATPGAECAQLEAEVLRAREQVEKVLSRYRAWARRANALRLLERTRASLRLVDEYMSLTVEQLLRRAVADMDQLPRSGAYQELRRGLMGEVLAEERYRLENKLRSVLSPTGDNEEYMLRLGFLKKFCMNVLFLSARRDQRHHGWEEVLFALAAGVAMAFATAVALWAQVRFTQVSLNFFLIMVVGYMMKDRIKEGLRRIFTRALSLRLHDRTTRIVDPASRRCLGTCAEKVDYGAAVRVPKGVMELRCQDDFVTVAQGELAETVLRYHKQVVLDAALLPRSERGVSGITDIIRFNVERFLRDMDEPEFALEYVDLEDFSVGRVRGAKSYQVDLIFRFTVHAAGQRRVTLQGARLVMDRNGIKRLLRFEPDLPPRPEPVSTAA